MVNLGKACRDKSAGRRICLCFLMLVLLSCGSMPTGIPFIGELLGENSGQSSASSTGQSSGQSGASSTGRSSASSTGQSAPSSAVAAAPAAPSGPPPFSGDGGMGQSISILSPAARGLAEADAYLPTLVQGVLVSDFTRFSAISVLDRERLDQILWENESGYYPDEADIARIGHTVPSDYLMIGTLSSAGAAFMLQISVVDSQTTLTHWSHTARVTRPELEDFSAIKTASEDLLTQMGVSLTDAGRQALRGTNSQTLGAETALARGVTAQREGSTVAALSFLTEAANFNADIPEADTRLANLSYKIESGNLGENVRNELQQAREWQKLLDEAVEFFRYNPIFDIVYNENPKQGRIDFQKKTVDISFDLWLEPNARFYAMDKIIKAAESTGRTRDWLLDDKLGRLGMKARGNYWMGLIAKLYNENGDYLGIGGAGGISRPEFHTKWDILGAEFHEEKDNRWALLRPAVLTFYGVNAELIGDKFSVDFVEAGRAEGRGGGLDILNNAIQNVRITPTDKTRDEYFRGRIGYSNFSNATNDQYTKWNY